MFIVRYAAFPIGKYSAIIRVLDRLGQTVIQRAP
jgi:hypothetical protein